MAGEPACKVPAGRFSVDEDAATDFVSPLSDCQAENWLKDKNVPCHTKALFPPAMYTLLLSAAMVVLLPLLVSIALISVRKFEVEITLFWTVRPGPPSIKFGVTWVAMPATTVLLTMLALFVD